MRLGDGYSRGDGVMDAEAGKDADGSQGKTVRPVLVTNQSRPQSPRFWAQARLGWLGCGLWLRGRLARLGLAARRLERRCATRAWQPDSVGAKAWSGKFCRKRPRGPGVCPGSQVADGQRCHAAQTGSSPAGHKWPQEASGSPTSDDRQGGNRLVATPLLESLLGP